MSDRNTILTTLKTDIEDYIKTSRGYNTDVAEVQRGIQMFEDIVNKPAVCFWCYKDEGQGAFAQVEKRVLYVYIYGYCDTDGYSVDKIHDLASDVDYFLFNDFTYTDDTGVGDITIYEGGIQDPAGIFELEIQIKYDNTTNVR